MKLKIGEKEIQNQIIEWLKWSKCFFWRNNSGAIFTEYKGRKHMYRFGSIGSPDIFVVKKGKIYGIEVKSATGKQSPEQKSWQQAFEISGGKYILARKLYDVSELI